MFKVFIMSTLFLYSCVLLGAEKEPNVIGTHLMRYFIVGLKYSKENTPLPTLTYEKVKNNPEISLFYRKLPRFLKLNKEETHILNRLPKSTWSLRITWNPIFFANIGEKAYLDYHKLVRSVSQRTVPKALTDMGYKIEVEHPVIHYRLGDVPFCRHKGHHLNKYAYYLWALEKISNSGIDTSTVIIITSNKHKSDEKMKETSDLYLADFIDFLNEKGYNTIIQSESILYDFATMVFAPAVIGGSSSFSFAAGLSCKGPFLFYKLGTEENGSYFAFDNCSWMYPSNPILHCEIKNYYNTEDVFKKLRE